MQLGVVMTSGCFYTVGLYNSVWQTFSDGQTELRYQHRTLRGCAMLMCDKDRLAENIRSESCSSRRHLRDTQ